MAEEEVPDYCQFLPKTKGCPKVVEEPTEGGSANFEDFDFDPEVQATTFDTFDQGDGDFEQADLEEVDYEQVKVQDEIYYPEAEGGGATIGDEFDYEDYEKSIAIMEQNSELIQQARLDAPFEWLMKAMTLMRWDSISTEMGGITYIMVNAFVILYTSLYLFRYSTKSNYYA